MRNYKITDLVPPPPNRGDTDQWKVWCMQASDKMLDVCTELQRSSIASDALWSAVMTVIYEIPAGLFGKKLNDIFTLDILDYAKRFIGEETYLRLKSMHDKHESCKHVLANAFRKGLKQNDIKAKQWCYATGQPTDQILPWLQFSARLENEKPVRDWLNDGCPFPIPPYFFHENPKVIKPVPNE